MIVKVLAFGIARDIFQNTYAEFDIKEKVSAAQLKVILEEKYPKLKALRSYLLAVNNEYAGEEQTVNATDEIAVIPPVSGG